VPLADPAELLDAATGRTGLEDFGPPSFREGLDVLVAALRSEALLSPAGHERMRGMIVGRLVNRLEIQALRTREPGIAVRPIQRPWFIVGGWRTGTTALSYLLAQDPANRSLRRWETSRPCPPPGMDAAADRERLDQTRQLIAAQDREYPELRKINLQEADGPTECVIPLSHEFKGTGWDPFAYVPSFGAFNRRTDHASAYAFHRRFLEVLQWREPVPERWQLKAPGHLLALDALIAEYPDARLIFTHRDPMRALASNCSLNELLMRMSSDRVDPEAIGREWLLLHERALSNAVDFRARRPDVPCVDVGDAELARNPIVAVTRVYDALGAKLSNEAEGRMRNFLRAHPSGQHGRHDYAAERYGLRREEVAERLRSYCARFAAVLEGDR
jgi:hypothetical protein